MRTYLENVKNHYYFAYVGKFNPFHIAHKYVYDYLVSLMMKHDLSGDVYICTKFDDNDFLTSQQKIKMIELSGIPKERIVDGGGYNIHRLLNSISKGVIPENAVIVTAFSQKDLDDGSKKALMTPPSDNITSWRVIRDNNDLPYLRPYTFVHKEYEQVREQKLKKGTGYILIVPTQQADQYVVSSSYIRKLIHANEWDNVRKLIATKEAFEYLQKIKRSV